MAEAAVLCAKMSNRNKIIVARSVHREYRQVLRTYCWANGYTVVELPYEPSGQIDLEALERKLDDQVAAVVERELLQVADPRLVHPEDHVSQA